MSLLGVLESLTRSDVRELDMERMDEGDGSESWVIRYHGTCIGSTVRRPGSGWRAEPAVDPFVGRDDHPTRLEAAHEVLRYWKRQHSH
jgi:hypothetical protein